MSDEPTADPAAAPADPPPEPTPAPAEPPSAQPPPDIAVLTDQLMAREARIHELEQQLGAAAQELAAVRAGLGDAQRQGLEHLRRALLAEHQGQVIPELLVGATPAELEASVQTARAAFQRAADAARAQLLAQQLPASNPPRSDGDLASLPPTEKIARGLTQR